MIEINGITFQIIRTRICSNGDYEHLIYTSEGLTYVIEIL